MAEKPKEKVINIKDRKGNDVKTITLNDDESYLVHNGKLYTLKDFLFAGEIYTMSEEGKRIPLERENPGRAFFASELSADEMTVLSHGLRMWVDDKNLRLYNYFGNPPHNNK
ncbi:hypothetical protein P4679_26800 [Priestia megaterium]|uniref:hypothetical protein n=1 Tax=Priestia megaterium TaxID=1404 RepID=UPI002E1B675D|nr:hypothetical protein [Priestia megaterium]